LQITGNETSFDFPSSWLIPVLRDGIDTSTLSFFHTEIYPKAMACQYVVGFIVERDDRKFILLQQEMEGFGVSGRQKRSTHF
jgi:NUC173 domain